MENIQLQVQEYNQSAVDYMYFPSKRDLALKALNTAKWMLPQLSFHCVAEREMTYENLAKFYESEGEEGKAAYYHDQAASVRGWKKSRKKHKRAMRSYDDELDQDSNATIKHLHEKIAWLKNAFASQDDNHASTTSNALAQAYYELGVENLKQGNMQEAYLAHDFAINVTRKLLSAGNPMANRLLCSIQEIREGTDSTRYEDIGPIKVPEPTTTKVLPMNNRRFLTGTRLKPMFENGFQVSSRNNSPSNDREMRNSMKRRHSSNRNRRQSGLVPPKPEGNLKSRHSPTELSRPIMSQRSPPRALPRRSAAYESHVKSRPVPVRLNATMNPALGQSSPPRKPKTNTIIRPQMKSVPRPRPVKKILSTPKVDTQPLSISGTTSPKSLASEPENGTALQIGQNLAKRKVLKINAGKHYKTELVNAIIIIQKNYRCWSARRIYLQIRLAIVYIQRWFKQYRNVNLKNQVIDNTRKILGRVCRPRRTTKISKDNLLESIFKQRIINIFILICLLLALAFLSDFSIH